jgi:hypothetical protein
VDQAAGPAAASESGALAELSADIRSGHFTIANVPALLQGLKEDPWRKYFTVKQTLTRRMKAAIGI